MQLLSPSGVRGRQLWLLLLIPFFLLGCTAEDEDRQTGQTSTLQMMPLSSSMVDVRPITRSGYLPEGYVPYSELSSATNPDYAKIGIFKTPSYTNPEQDYFKQDTDAQGHGLNTWSSTVKVEAGRAYYLYGFMPQQAALGATISPLDNDYANGAVMHLDDFKTLTSADACVVVGVRKATEAEIAEGAPLEDVKLGTFAYEGDTESNNWAFVLLRHIYSGLQFRTVIDPEYHKLRDIKFTKVELIAKNIAETKDLDITITANDTGDDPLTSVVFSNSGPVTNSSVQLFPWAGSVTEYELKEEETSLFLACFVPESCTEFVLKTTYNVYDKDRNPIRKGCVAENKITSGMVPELASIKAGEVYTFTCRVKPTYLYVLSDPDLDNPTVEIGS